MVIRFTIMLAAAALAATGFTASALALTQGQTDQAIAFAWPSIAVAILLAFSLPGNTILSREADQAGLK
ncbi:hypothetical protein [Maricaulis sp.]|uniref:hypothetical protein n=1 Tax=Maricaulis sp. TaxID=1486257 RepID=UPI001B04BC96|nr:hypothetical protein [Maricaulis sp.]MBO6796147.1 hypothetical protein [Maricaulis sp.]